LGDEFSSRASIKIELFWCRRHDNPADEVGRV
jgi:hypothetical protein